MRKYIIAFTVSLFLFFGTVNALTKAPVDVTTMSIDELLDAMDKGYLTSETLVNIYLERIEAYDGMFNSINQINEHAVEQAKVLDDERESGKLRGKLHGIPILVKCNIDAYGMPTTAGTKDLADNYPKENSYVVQRLIDEGAIILGSTNMSELAFSAATSYSSYGYVKNVFNNEYTAYGSSGGAAVAVTAVFGAASLGTDTNSSVRLPAAGAGLVGMRPTLGLVSRTGVIPYDIERDTVGVLTRDVSDNALLLSIISGYDEEDIITKDAIVPSSNLSNANLEGVTIGVVMQYVQGNAAEDGVTGLTDTDIYNLTMDSVKKLEDAGATIVYLDDFVKSSNLTIATSTYAGRTMCDYFNIYIDGTTGTIRSFEELAASDGHVQKLSGYAAACGDSANSLNTRNKKKAKYRDYVSEYFVNHDLDVILYPTLKNKVYGYKSGKNISPGSSLGSVIGYPSITVPMGYIGEFSYGVEFLSTAYNENMLYNVAQGFESVSGAGLSVSTLTPSLYEVPTEVENLKKIYEDTLLLNSDAAVVKEWISDVEVYFSEYNNIDDVVSRANELIERNEKVVKKNSSEIFNFVPNNIFVKIFIVVLSVLALIVIFKEILRCF